MSQLTRVLSNEKNTREIYGQNERSTLRLLEENWEMIGFIWSSSIYERIFSSTGIFLHFLDKVDLNVGSDIFWIILKLFNILNWFFCEIGNCLIFESFFESAEVSRSIHNSHSINWNFINPWLWFMVRKSEFSNNVLSEEEFID